jgi:energy-coupling factor transporter ATP-binding protein EcfA2
MHDFQKTVHLGPEDENPVILESAAYGFPRENKIPGGSDILAVESLIFYYSDESPIFHDFSMSLGSGELVFLTGSNGAGKTTLAKLISGIMKPVSGEIFICGCSLKAISHHDSMRLIGFAPQNPNLNLTRKTVGEELVLAQRWGHSADELVDMLGLAGLLDRHPLELTQAEKKRLGIALAYSKPRKLIILDEPSQYQDQKGFMQVVEALKHMIVEGKGLLVITHDPRFFQAFPDFGTIRLSREGIY